MNRQKRRWKRKNKKIGQLKKELYISQRENHYLKRQLINIFFPKELPTIYEKNHSLILTKDYDELFKKWNLNRYNIHSFFFKLNLIAYVEYHEYPGIVILNIMKNDLIHAVFFANADFSKSLTDIVFWIWNEAPKECWGNPDKVEKWLEKKEE